MPATDGRGAGLVRLLSVAAALALVACGEPRQQAKIAAVPAERIIALAPHLTELTFSAAAGAQLVGVVDYSDYPPAALDIPRIGDAFRLDYERMVELEPDLVLAWKSGTPLEVIDRLEQLGLRVVVLDTDDLAGIADALREIGRYTGHAQQAERSAAEFEEGLADLRAANAGRERVRLFYQVSAEPLFTISRQHVIGESIELCGGDNIFAGLTGPSPAIATEAVIDAAPEAIIASRYTASAATGGSDPLAAWRRWQSIPAVRDDHLYTVDANLMTRPSLRILAGIRELCARIADARAQRAG